MAGPLCTHARARQRVVGVALVSVVLFFARNSPTVLDHLDSLLDRAQGARGINQVSRYLIGNFRPVASETSAPIRLRVASGAIPAGLSAAIVRIGPNPIAEHGHTKLYHWFDGHGMVHVCRIKGDTGVANYSSHWLRTPRYEHERALRRDYFPTVGELVGPLGLLRVLLDIGGAKARAYIPDLLRLGQANTAVLSWAGRVLALHEASLPFELSLRDDGSVASLGYSSLGGEVDAPLSAHARVDASTDELMLGGYALQPGSPAMKWGTLAPADLDGPPGSEGNFRTASNLSTRPFAHDFAFTAACVLLLDLSVQFTPEGILDEGRVFSFATGVHADFQGRFAMFGFASVAAAAEGSFSGVTKWRIEPGRGGLLSHTSYGAGRAGGDLALCAKPARAGAHASDGSDAVWVLVWIYDEASDASELLVLDGEATGEALPEVARLVLDGGRVPFGFHSTCIPEAELQRHIAASEARAARAAAAEDPAA
ncbi:retinal pigment epithelial membrane protein-domain-containing protein [Pavlovales sp. CCMP2436]|nr:retinal pigment epithelial membrane protein-domain-containing protein [Pavlovales sp. CCMP2436]